MLSGLRWRRDNIFGLVGVLEMESVDSINHTGLITVLAVGSQVECWNLGKVSTCLRHQ